MTDLPAHEALIGQLAGELQPVRRLPGPWQRAGLWLVPVVWTIVLIASLTDLRGFIHRTMSAPDMWLAFIGAAITAVLAAVAAFATSIPGRSAYWGLLPLPSLALWVGASLAGIFRRMPLPGAMQMAPMEVATCMWIIGLVAVPMAVLFMVMLMRACPLRPGLTASLGGLASAGAAATVLSQVHPYDAGALDLAAHLVAIVLVVGGARLLGVRFVHRGLGMPSAAP